MTNDPKITPDDWLEFFFAIAATLVLLWCLSGGRLLKLPS